LPRKKPTTREIEKKFEETAFRLSQERSDFLLPQIIDFVQTHRWINLRPEYQRRSVWDVRKRSLFIESLLLNIPIPPIFLFEKALSRYEVMDGQQRLNAVVDFYENGFALKGLERWPELNGLRLRELPELLKRGLDRRRISATVILAESSKELNFGQKDIRKLVFERLNQGGQTLNAQELRNCLYFGHFNDLLVELSGNPNFTEAWNIPPHGDHIDSEGNADVTLQDNQLYKRMQDCQIVLRFFAFQDPKRIRGSVKTTLDRAMEERVGISASEAERLGKLFERTIEGARRVFGSHPFNLESEKGKSAPSVPLYDAVMFVMSRSLDSLQILAKNRVAIQGRLKKLTRRKDAYELLTNKANTSESTRIRLTLLEKVIQG